MRLIIGIGDPGARLARTRHNAGFIVIDQIASILANIHPRLSTFEWEIRQKFCLLVIKPEPLTILVKPRTYLTEIGITVRTLVQFYKLEPEDLFIVHDDLSLKLGEYKIENMPLKVPHKAVSNIEEKLLYDRFFKIRIGVETRGTFQKEDDEVFLTKELEDTEFAYLKHVGDMIIKDLDLDFRSPEAK